MQITRLNTHILVALVVALTLANPAEVALSKQMTTLVEVWCVGDDGLTIRLRDTLESAFSSSREFHLSTGKKPGTLVVTIPSNVGWKQVGKRIKVHYTVEFASADGHGLNTSKGTCWDDALTKCAVQIVHDAKITARKLH
jgi:hypothetical protein